jgi:hypothetical protein
MNPGKCKFGPIQLVHGDIPLLDLETIRAETIGYCRLPKNKDSSKGNPEKSMTRGTLEANLKGIQK